MTDFQKFDIWLQTRNLRMIELKIEMQKKHKNKIFDATQFDDEIRWHEKYITFLDMFEAARRAD